MATTLEICCEDLDHLISFMLGHLGHRPCMRFGMWVFVLRVALVAAVLTAPCISLVPWLQTCLPVRPKTPSIFKKMAR